MTYSRTLKTTFKIAKLAFVTSAMFGCASDVSKYNEQHLEKTDTKSQKLITERVVTESEKLFTNNNRLISSFEKTTPIELKEKQQSNFQLLEGATITVTTRNGSIQDLLTVMAKQAKLGLIIEPEVLKLDQKISISLEDVPASQVFEDIMRMLDLSAKVENNILYVSPYEERLYQLDFISSSSKLDVNMGGDVFGANSGVVEGGAQSVAGSLQLAGEGIEEADPYGELVTMLDVVVGKQSSESQGADSMEQSKSPVSRIRPFNSSDLKGHKSAKNETESHSSEAGSVKYSLNKATGTLYVKARPSQINVVDDLVNEYKDTLSRQILIEAQILDVSLNENFNFGIDWTAVGENFASAYNIPVELGGLAAQIPDGSFNPGRTITIPGRTIGDNGNLSVAFQNEHFSAIADMMQEFGTVRVLSNPILRAKNTRPAFISVGRNTSYIAKSTSDVSTDDVGTTTTVDVEVASVFDGIILGVEPFISKDGKINLVVHPLQSEVQDSSLALVELTPDNKITLPVVDFKGLTTSLTLNSGDTVILGGLTDEVSNDNGGGLPYLSDIPYVGSAFGGTSNSKTVREMVIVLRVTRL